MTTTSPASPQLDLVCVRRRDRTVLLRRIYEWPYVLTRTFHLDELPAELLTVILQTSSGAIHGEDRLSQRLHVERDAAARLVTQGATAVHRADGDLVAREDVEIRVEPGGFFEYAPEPRILFPGAALDQRIELDCATGAAAIVVDGFTVHDPSGAGRSFRRLVSTFRLRHDGELMAFERADLPGLDRRHLARHSAFGTVVLARPGQGAPDALADRISAELEQVDELYGAASALPNAMGIGIRLAGRDLRALRTGFDVVRALLWQELFGGPPTRPRFQAPGPSATSRPSTSLRSDRSATPTPR